MQNNEHDFAGRIGNWASGIFVAALIAFFAYAYLTNLTVG